MNVLLIRERILQILKEEFPGEEIYTPDKTEGMNTPCFFIDISKIKRSNLGNHHDQTLLFTIKRMLKKRNYMNHVSVAETLENRFNVLHVADRCFTVDDTDWYIDDKGNLVFTFLIEYLDGKDVVEEHEKMNELYWRDYSGTT